MTAAKVMDIISRLPGVQDKQRTQYPFFSQVKMDDAQTLLKIPKSECPDIWMRLPRHKWPKSSFSMEDSVVPLEPNLNGHLLAGLLWERQFEKILLKYGWEGMLICTPWRRIILISVFGWHKIGWKETKSWSDVESTQQRSWFGRTNIIPWSCFPGVYSKTMWNKQRYCGQLQNHVRIANVSGVSRKTTIPSKYSNLFVVLRYGRSCQEVCRTISWVGKQDDSTTLQSIYSMHCWPSFQRRRTEIRGRIIKSMLSNCSEMPILGTNWKTWNLWSVNKLARSITKWTKACDKRLSRLISYIHHAWEYKQYCHVGNIAKQCRLGLFQDSDFAEDLEDSKSTSGGTLCVFRNPHVCSNSLDV